MADFSSPTVATPGTSESLEVHSPKWTTAFIGLSTIIMTLDTTIVNVALSAIAKDFHAPLTSVQWVINAYTLMFASLLIGVGAISDYFGRKHLFLLGHMLFLLASFSCMIAVNPAMLIAARAFQGAGAALVFGTCIPLIADTYAGYPVAKRNQAIGISMTISVAAVAFGPLVGGIILQKAGDFAGHGSWPWLFGINLPLCLLCIVGGAFLIPNNYKKLRAAQGQVEDHPASVDYLTIALTAVGLLSLNYATLIGAQVGWFSVQVGISLMIGVVSIVLMVLRQKRRGDRALINLNMFTIPSYTSVIILGFVSKMFSFGIFSYIIYWLFGVAELGPIQIGASIMLLAIPMILVAGVVGKLGEKIGSNNVIAIGMIISGIGLLLGILVAVDSHWTAIVPTLILVGVGGGFVSPFMMDIAVSVVPPHKQGIATGMANAAFPLGTSTGVAVNGAILASYVNHAYRGNTVFPELPGYLATKIQDYTTTGGAHMVRELTEAYLGAPAARDLENAAIHHASWGTAIIFALTGIAALASAALGKWGIRDEDRWSDTQPDA